MQNTSDPLSVRDLDHVVGGGTPRGAAGGPVPIPLPTTTDPAPPTAIDIIGFLRAFT